MGTIYKLCFNDSSFYVGKTTKTIETRIRNHLNSKGKGSPKLEKAFAIEDNYIGYEILEDNITKDIIDATEQWWITKLNPPLNTLPGGEGMSGLNHPRSRYTQDQINLAVKLLITTGKTYKEIEEITDIKTSTLRDITHGRGQAWIYEACPEVLEANEIRGNQTYYVWDRNNNQYVVTNIHKFCEEHITCSKGVFKGTNNMNGWSLQKHQIFEIEKMDQRYKDTLFNIKQILKAEGLSRFQIQRISKGLPSAGWEVKNVL